MADRVSRLKPAAVLIAILLAGCGGPKLVPVAGTVTIDGKPLSRGYLFVMPSDARAAGGEIDSQGRFKLTTTDPGDGVKPGTHPVAVTSLEHISNTRVRHLIPTKYSQAETSELTVTIDKATDELAIELTWAGGKPYVVNFDGQGDIGPTLDSSDSKAKP